MTPGRTVIGAVLPFLVYASATAYVTWPLLDAGASSHILSHWSPEDILLVIWILRWDVHALAHDPASLFQGNVLHPVENVLLHSEHLLGCLPIFGPFFALTGNPVLSFNCVVFASFLLGGLFMHLLVRDWTGSTTAAYVAGLAFALAPWRAETFHWPQLLNIQYLPLILYALDRVARGGGMAVMSLAAAALALESLASYYLAYMAVVLTGFYVLCDVSIRGIRGRGSALGRTAIALIVPLAVVAVVSLPYLSATRQYSTEDMQRNEVFLAMAPYIGRADRVIAEYSGWKIPSLALLALLIPGWWRDRNARVQRFTLLLTLVVALGIAVGPAGYLGGLFSPYSWLSAVVPGFSLIRGPARFGILVSFAASGLAGIAAASLVRLARRQGRAATGAVLVLAVALPLVLLDSWKRPPKAIPLATGEQVAPVYRWLAAHGDGGPLLELPLSRRRVRFGNVDQLEDALAMYHSTYHWLPVLNGYTGYPPVASEALREYEARLPDQNALQVLVDCTGFRWILTRRLRPEDVPLWNRTLGVELRRVFSRPDGGEDALFEVTLPATDTCPVDLGRHS